MTQVNHNAASRREAMAAGVRKALSDAGSVEFGQIITRYGVPVNARCGFTVIPTSGVTAIVTFQGPPPETHATRSFLASYEKALANTGFWAQADYAAGYVAVEVAETRFSGQVPGQGTELPARG